jgi:hypothetical protein
VGDIDFKVISAVENSNKFQKTKFWKEKSVEDMVTIAPRAQATLFYSIMNLNTISRQGQQRLHRKWNSAMFFCFCQYFAIK